LFSTQKWENILGKNKKYFTLYSPALLLKEEILLERAEKSQLGKRRLSFLLCTRFPPPTKASLRAPSDSDSSPIFVEKKQVNSKDSFALHSPHTIIAKGGDE